jgi:hypothetical protein
MRISLLFIHLFWATIILQSQVEIRQICMDPTGFRYEVYDSKIVKKNSRDEILFSNDFPQLGKIDHLDIINPLQPCLFFMDNQKILVVDNTLSFQNNPIDLSQPLDNGVLPYYTAACAAASSGFWAFDNVQKKIIRLDPYGQKLFELAQLQGYFPAANWNILWMQESNNELFLRDNDYLHHFDFTGAYLDSTLRGYAVTAVCDGNVFELSQNELWMIYPNQIKIPLTPAIKEPFTIVHWKAFDSGAFSKGIDIKEFVNK